MPDLPKAPHTRRRPRIGARICSVLLLTAPLPNCGSIETYFLVNPGAFDYLNCKELAQTTIATQTRQQELKVLIDRAEQGAFGTFVATTAYRPQYLKTQGDLKLLAETEQNKNCVAGSDGPAIGRPAMNNPQANLPPR